MKYTYAILLFALVGCAQHQVILRSSEMTPLDPLESKQAFTKLNGSVALTEVADERESVEDVGTAVTGMLNEETPIVLDVPTTDYVKDRFSKGFASRGLALDGATPKNELRATIKKLRVWEDASELTLEHSKCEVEIAYEVVSKKTSAPVFRGTVSSQAQGTYNFLDTTDSNGPVLESCMTGVVEKLAQNKELRAALDWDVVSRTEY